MAKFRVGLSADFRKPDGSAAFPSFDLSPLDDEPQIDWSYVPVTERRIAASDIAGFDALILLGARFDAESFPPDGRLCLIARFGVGFDTVDVAACDDNDVALVTTPSGVRRPVAVAILTLILALAGRLMTKDRLTRQGPEGWAQVSNHMGQGLIGLTLGSIGIGNIGAEMFEITKPLSMNSIAYDPFADPDVAKRLGVELVSLEELFKRSDYLCVNCPLSDETHGIVNAAHLALMKPTAYLINTARGPIVDQAALTEALSTGQIAGAGLDVFEQEPSSADDPIFHLDNVITTPHSLCWTDQCFAGIGAADVNAVLAVLAGQVPDGIVNRSITENGRWAAKLAKRSTANA
ncbi:MAG: dehydrogenase [Alphaproteobacteria bacterium]|nr:dehydrogenase [Alphaproteobacteria bacterium]